MGDKGGGKGYAEAKGGGKSALKTPYGEGKGDKAASNGSNKAVKNPTPPLHLTVDLPENVTCLMDWEAAQVLERIQEQMTVLSEDPAIKIPVLFDKGLQRAKRGSNYTSLLSVKEVLKNLKIHGVADSELCLIANIHPESADEVFSLVPSLKGKKNKLEEPLKSVLGEPAKIECSA